MPRAAVGLREAGADREDDVGLAGRLVGGLRPPNARDAHGQRVIFGKRSFAHQAGGHGGLHQLRQLPQFVPRFGQQHAVAGEDDRPLSGCQ